MKLRDYLEEEIEKRNELSEEELLRFSGTAITINKKYKKKDIFYGFSELEREGIRRFETRENFLYQVIMRAVDENVEFAKMNLATIDYRKISKEIFRKFMIEEKPLDLSFFSNLIEEISPNLEFEKELISQIFSESFTEDDMSSAGKIFFEESKKMLKEKNKEGKTAKSYDFEHVKKMAYKKYADLVKIHPRIVKLLVGIEMYNVSISFYAETESKVTKKAILSDFGQSLFDVVSKLNPDGIKDYIKTINERRKTKDYPVEISMIFDKGMRMMDEIKIKTGKRPARMISSWFTKSEVSLIREYFGSFEAMLYKPNKELRALYIKTLSDLYDEMNAGEEVKAIPTLENLYLKLKENDPNLTLRALDGKISKQFGTYKRLIIQSGIKISDYQLGRFASRKQKNFSEELFKGPLKESEIKTIERILKEESIESISKIDLELAGISFAKQKGKMEYIRNYFNIKKPHTIKDREEKIISLLLAKKEKGEAFSSSDYSLIRSIGYTPTNIDQMKDFKNA